MESISFVYTHNSRLVLSWCLKSPEYPIHTIPKIIIELHWVVHFLSACVLLPTVHIIGEAFHGNFIFQWGLGQLFFPPLNVMVLVPLTSNVAHCISLLNQEE